MSLRSICNFQRQVIVNEIFGFCCYDDVQYDIVTGKMGFTGMRLIRDITW